MAIIVETGTGASNSESYASVADALTYHANRGNDTWATITTTQQEQALRRATDFIEQRYNLAWQGYRSSSTQALSWPRNSVTVNGYVIGSALIPQILINATCEMALRAAAGELDADLERGVLREKVGALEVEYDKTSLEKKRYVAVENMLKPLFASSSSLYVGLNRA